MKLALAVRGEIAPVEYVISLSLRLEPTFW
jgi:hypothetical protein